MRSPFTGVRSAFMEMKNLRSSGWKLFSVCFIAIIPLIYAGLFLLAFLDPYGSLSQVPAVVVNLDKGAEINGEQQNVGQELCTTLVENNMNGEEGEATGFDWKFVNNLDDATQGLKDGTYYMELIIPENFSESIASAEDSNPSQAELQAYFNPSTNLIAQTVGSSMVTKIKAELNKKIDKEYFNNIFVSISDASDSLKTAVNGSKDLQSGLKSARDGSNTITVNLGTLATGAGTLDTGLKSLSDGATQLDNGVGQVATGVASLDNGLGDLSTGATTLSAGTQQLEDKSGELADGASGLSSGLQSLDAYSETIANGSAGVLAGLNKLQSGSETYEKTFTAIAAQYNSAYSENIDNAQSAYALALAAYVTEQSETNLKNLKTAQSKLTELYGYKSAADAFTTAVENHSDINKGIKELDTSYKELDEGIQTYTEGVSKVAAGANSLNTGVGAAVDGIKSINTGASQLAAGTVSAKTGADQLVTGTNTLKYGTASLASGAISASKGVTSLVSGAQQLKDGSQTLTDGLNTAYDGTGTLVDGLAEGQENMEDSSQNAEERSDMMSEPVTANGSQNTGEKITQVANYGTGFAPYFIGLGMWVGCLMITFLLRSLNNRILMSNSLSFSAVLSSYLPMVAIAFIQVIILLLFIQFGLGFNINFPLQYYLFGLLTALAFVAIIQFFRATFGVAGMVVVVVLLMLQLCTAAGTFPIEAELPIFNMLNPILPMTYVVRGFRMAMCGLSVEYMIQPAIVLIGFTVLFLALTTAVAASRRRATMITMYPNIKMVE